MPEDVLWENRDGAVKLLFRCDQDGDAREHILVVDVLTLRDDRALVPKHTEVSLTRKDLENLRKALEAL